MANLKQKTKEWYDNNKDNIKTVGLKILEAGYYGGVGALCAYIGYKAANYSITCGLEKFHKDGLLKFFDVSTGKEVDIKEAVRLMDEMYGKK